VEPQDGISFEVETKARQIKVKGYDRELVGQGTADIRKTARQSRTTARASTIWVKRSAVKPAKPEKLRSR